MKYGRGKELAYFVSLCKVHVDAYYKEGLPNEDDTVTCIAKTLFAVEKNNVYAQISYTFQPYLPVRIGCSRKGSLDAYCGRHLTIVHY